MIDVLKLANVVAKLIHPQYGRSTSALLLRDLVADALRKELDRQMLAAQDDIEAAVDAAMVEMVNITPPLRRSECRRLILAARAAGPQSGAWVLAESVRALAYQLEASFGNTQSAQNLQLCDVVSQAAHILRHVNWAKRREEVWVERAYRQEDGTPVVERMTITNMPDWLQALYRR